MTTQNEGEQFNTNTSLPIDSEATEVHVTDSVHALEETASSPPQDIRTVPIASVNGSIKLRYAPREDNIEQNDSSTQT